MALLHATQFYNGRPTADGAQHTLYTVPSGDRIILRDINLQEAGGGAPYIIFYVNGYRILTSFLTAHLHSDNRFWLVVGPGQTISCLVQSGFSVDVTISGSLYTI